MESPQNLQELVSTLQRESELCNRLHAALQAEHQALQQNNPDLLDTAVKEKQTCISALEQNELALFKRLPTQGFSPNTDGFRQFLESLDKNDPLGINDQWQAVLKKIENCQQLNQVNGRIVNVAIASTQQVLNLLNGRDAITPTYNHSGKSDDDKDGPNSLAIA